MMAKKESTAKKVGKFVANELLGVDDARRAVKYARKGEWRKAAKSAGAAVLEAGSTIAPVGAGAKVGKFAGKAVARAVGEETRKGVAKAAYRAKKMDKIATPQPEKAARVKRAASNRDLTVKQSVRNNGKTHRVTTREKLAGKPQVKTIKEKVTREQANKTAAISGKSQRTKVGNEARRAGGITSQSKILPKVGKRVGGTAGAATAAEIARQKANKQNKKK